MATMSIPNKTAVLIPPSSAVMERLHQIAVEQRVLRAQLRVAILHETRGGLDLPPRRCGAAQTVAATK